jgi:copper homeostasis protein
MANESEIRRFGFGPAERRLADPDRIQALKAAANFGDPL